MVSSSASAQNRMPSWLTWPSTDCTRCSSGSSAERDCGYLAMISFARVYVTSSNTPPTIGWSAGPSQTTSSGAADGPMDSGMPSGSVIGRSPP